MALSFTKWVKGIFVQNESDRTKELGLTVSNSASGGTSTNLVAKQTLSRTLDLPNVSGELVEKDYAQILTNKTIDGDDNTIQDVGITSLKTEIADASKFIARDVSGQVVSVNTVPNSNVVGINDTQTLTNKTISGSSNTITNVDGDNVVVDPVGNLSSTNAQAALVELQGDIDTLNSNKVTGPASATDNAVARFDATTGKLIQNSAVIIDDSNNVTGVNNLTVSGDLTVNGATTTINTQDLDVTDKNITVNKSGSDVSSQGAGLTVDRVGTKGSLVYDSAVASKFKIGNLASEVEVLTATHSQSIQNKNLKSNTNLLSGAKSNSFERETGNQQVVTIPDVSGADTFLTQAHAQVITNKDIDGGTASNTSRITVPQNSLTNLLALTRKEGTIVYATDTDKFYSDDGSTLKEIGSGAGSVNFISNGDAEANAAGYVAYLDSGARPTDGIGGSPAGVTFTRSITNPLSGQASFLFSKDAVNRQGSGFSYDFTIDQANKAKVQDISIDYQVVSGVFNAGSPGVDSGVIVYIYAKDSGILVEPSSIKFLSNSTTITDKFKASFQTTASDLNYRLIFHVASTNASAYVLKMDSVKVSPSNYVYGTPITDFQPYTPTLVGFGTATAVDFQWRRVGDSVEVFGKFTSGTSSGATASVTLPSGITVDALKLLSIRAKGKYINQSPGIANKGGGTLASPSSNLVTFGAIQTFGSGATSQTLTSQVGTSIAISGDIFSFEFEAPITGWSSSVQMSDSADTRVFAESMTTTASQNINNGATDKINLNSVNHSSHGASDAGTNKRINILISGYYDIKAQVALNNGVSQERLIVYIYKNGLAVVTGLSRGNATGADSAYISKDLFLVAGDYIELYCGNDTGAASLVINGSSFTFLDVSRKSGPSAIAASETISCSYRTAAGQSIPNNVETTVVFGTKDFDTHNAFNPSTGVFTAPAPGIYECSSVVTLNPGAASGSRQVYLKTGASYVATLSQFVFASVRQGAMGAAQVRLNAGDTLFVTSFQNSGGAITVFANAVENVISIKRVGN